VKHSHKQMMFGQGEVADRDGMQTGKMLGVGVKTVLMTGKDIKGGTTEHLMPRLPFKMP